MVEMASTIDRSSLPTRGVAVPLAFLQKRSPALLPSSGWPFRPAPAAAGGGVPLAGGQRRYTNQEGEGTGRRWLQAVALTSRSKAGPRGRHFLGFRGRVEDGERNDESKLCQP